MERELVRMNSIIRNDAGARIRRSFGRPRPDRRHWIIRPDDLLVVDFDLQNLRVEPANGDAPARLVKSGRGQALLTVIFPPQHISEIAYFTNVKEHGYPVEDSDLQDPDKVRDIDAEAGTDPLDDPPIWTVSAGWSRLVFVVPDEVLPIPWTLSDVLRLVGRLDLSVPANALPPGDDPLLYHSSLADIVRIASAELAGPASGVNGGIIHPREVMSTAAPLLLAARARRQLRVNARVFGLSDLTGSDTADLPATLTAAFTAPGIAAALTRPAPRPPSTRETAIELPFELFLSPNRFAAWAHAPAPVRSTISGHTELWHTRLAVRDARGGPVEGPDPKRCVRATWTTAGLTLTTPPFGTSVNAPGAGSAPRQSMDAFDKHNVVHLSSNFQLQDPDRPRRYFEPRPIDVNNLALSSLGAWMDTRGVWDSQPSGLSVEEWRHRATMARDHYVRLVYRGVLFPWGHRASLIKITERQFDHTRAGTPAYLFQRMFIVVREPVRAYGNSRLLYEGPDSATRRHGERIDLMLPFSSVRVTTLVSPLLDRPDDDIAGGQESCFWPFVGGQPFKFHLVASDVDGNAAEFAMPLIFVRKEHLDKPHVQSVIPAVASDYESRVWPGSAQKRSTVPLLGQRVAFARSVAPDDTTFSAERLTFGAEVPLAATYDGLDPRHPRFVPVLRGAQINVPSLQAIANTATPASMVYASAYLVDGFEGQNKGEVFLGADPSTPAFRVSFSAQADRSGALLTPDLDVSGISRVAGPIAGALTLAEHGSFDPKSWFSSILSARLFGAVKLEEIIETVGFDQLEKIPRFSGQMLNPIEKLIIDLVQLRQQLASDAAGPGAAAIATLDQLTDPANGSLPALVGGGPVAAVVAQLGALDAALTGVPGALAGAAISAGPRAALEQRIVMTRRAIGGALATPATLTQFASGDELPTAIAARFEWRPCTRASESFRPIGDRNLVLAVEAAGDTFAVTCSLDDFTLDLGVVAIEFERVLFRVVGGSKPDVDVKLRRFDFGGPLSFVQTLRDLIPLDGFSDPPRLDVTPEGITSGFSVGLPNIAVGVFSLENLAISAGFALPFIGKPMSAWFRFCERENPARLTVALFGGGFYFGVTVNADDLQALEGAIEFGAAVSVDLGVAAGGVSVMAGLYFKIESNNTTLAGYFRMRGMVRALAIVTVTLEMYLEMRYETGSGKCVGTATVSLEVEIAMFSVSVSVTVSKKFAGSNADPTLAEIFDVAADATSADWNAYCAAFA